MIFSLWSFYTREFTGGWFLLTPTRSWSPCRGPTIELPSFSFTPYNHDNRFQIQSKFHQFSKILGYTSLEIYAREQVCTCKSWLDIVKTRIGRKDAQIRHNAIVRDFPWWGILRFEKKTRTRQNIATSGEAGSHEAPLTELMVWKSVSPKGRSKRISSMFPNIWLICAGFWCRHAACIAVVCHCCGRLTPTQSTHFNTTPN